MRTLEFTVRKVRTESTRKHKGGIAYDRCMEKCPYFKRIENIPSIGSQACRKCVCFVHTSELSADRKGAVTCRGDELGDGNEE